MQIFLLARFHLQDDEMAYATGRYMRHTRFNHGYEVDDVVGMVRLVYKNRVVFQFGQCGYRAGHQRAPHRRTYARPAVRARVYAAVAGWCSRRTPVISMSTWNRPAVFPTVFNVGEMVDGYEILKRLADSHGPHHPRS